MSLAHVLTFLALDQVREKVNSFVNKVVEIFAPFVKYLADNLLNFNENPSTYKAFFILFAVLALLILTLSIIGLINFINRKPKLLITIIVVLALVCGIAFWASMQK